MIEFFAAGIPATKGSMKAFVRGKRAIVTHDNARTKPWQGVVAHAAHEAGVTPLEGPVAVELAFFFPRPSGHLGSKGLKRSAPALPITRSSGDVDKLARSVLDALTGVAYRDDSQVVQLVARKTFSGLRGAGVRVVIESEGG